MSAWQNARKAAFLAMLGEFGSTLQINGIEYTCLSTSKATQLEQMRNDFMPKRPTTFSILREVFDALIPPMQPRDNLTSLGFQFQVYQIDDDDADATVDLRCNLLV